MSTTRETPLPLPTSPATALGALLPATLVGFCIGLFLPGPTLVTWLGMGLGGVATFAYLGRQDTFRGAVGTGLYLVALCALIMPVWLFLRPAMGGDALVSVIRFGIFGAVFAVAAVVCAGAGFLLQR